MRALIALSALAVFSARDVHANYLKFTEPADCQFFNMSDPSVNIMYPRAPRGGDVVGATLPLLVESDLPEVKPDGSPTMVKVTCGDVDLWGSNIWTLSELKNGSASYAISTRNGRSCTLAWNVVDSSLSGEGPSILVYYDNFKPESATRIMNPQPFGDPAKNPNNVKAGNCKWPWEEGSTAVPAKPSKSNSDNASKSSAESMPGMNKIILLTVAAIASIMYSF